MKCYIKALSYPWVLTQKQSFLKCYTEALSYPWGYTEALSYPYSVYTEALPFCNVFYIGSLTLKCCTEAPSHLYSVYTEALPCCNVFLQRQSYPRVFHRGTISPLQCFIEALSYAPALWLFLFVCITVSYKIVAAAKVPDWPKSICIYSVAVTELGMHSGRLQTVALHAVSSRCLMCSWMVTVPCGR